MISNISGSILTCQLFGRMTSPFYDNHDFKGYLSEKIRFIFQLDEPLVSMQV